MLLGCGGAAQPPAAGWTKQTTLEQMGSAPSFKDIFFLDAQTGWAAGNNNFLAKTSDGGATWARVLPENDSRYVGTVRFVSPTVGLFVYENTVDGTTGIYRTTDGGTTWNQVLGAYIGAQFIGGLQDLRMVDAQTGVAVGLKGTIVHTTDGGATWTMATVDHDYYAKPVDFYGVDFIDTTRGFVCGIDGTILKTTDAGATWTTVLSDDFTAQTTTLTGTGRQFALRFLDANDGVLTTDTGLFKTADGGTTWKRVAMDLVESNTNDYALGLSDASTLYATAGQHEMVASSDLGETWSEVNVPSTTGMISPLGFTLVAAYSFVAGHGWAIGGNGEVYTTP
ncbi:MAG: YCF48-related protein [Kofleriaceae bacterium]